MKKRMAKARNPQDSTLRNVRAARNRLALLVLEVARHRGAATHRFKNLEARIAVLESKVDRP